MQYLHPWNFGIKPSEYLKQKKNIDDTLKATIEEVGIDTLDALFEHTLTCPPPRELSEEQYGYIMGLLDKGLKEFPTLTLVASHVKPAGITELNVKFDTDLLKPLGIESVDHKNQLIIGFDNYSVEVVAEYRQRYQGDNLTCALVEGIMYGYPLGDVIEFRPRDAKYLRADLHAFAEGDLIKTLALERELKTLSHVPLPLHWTEHWRDTVGMDGEFELAKKYKKIHDRAKPHFQQYWANVMSRHYPLK